MRLITAEQGRHPEEEGEYELHHPRLHDQQYLKGDHDQHSLHNQEDDDNDNIDDGYHDDDGHASPSPSLTASPSPRSSPCPTMSTSTPSPPLSDTEECEVDPFCHKLQLTKWQWLRSVLLALTLFPLRLVMVFTCVLTAWSLCHLATWGMTEETLAERPLTGWRRKLNRMSMFLGRRVTNSAGFIVRIKGRRASPEEAPILTVAPHSTYFDGLVAFWSNSPYIVSRKENRAIPFIGKCIECAQALLVSREDPASRQKTVKEILRRSEPDSDWPQLVIFPEGSTANRKALMSFKPGAFYPARPVQPVVIRYPNKLDTVTW